MEDAIAAPLALIDTLPSQWPDDLIPAIRKGISESGKKIVILDDDPTGTQTSRNVPVLTQWSVEALVEELKKDGHAFFILTNSRSLPEFEATVLAHEIGRNLSLASQETGVRLTVISRSDSTLRGHFPAEVRKVAKAMGEEHLPFLVIPFFLEGGRYTIDDIHYVAEGKMLIPAAQTSFARDAAFGFRNSNLRLWIAEKTKGEIAAGRVSSISIDDIRRGGPSRVADLLAGVKDHGACIVNAASYRDMEVIVLALLQAAKRGREFLLRTAASFVRTCMGMENHNSLLAKKELVSSSACGGLFIIGSYIEKTSRQVAMLLAEDGVVGMEMDVASLLDQNRRDAEIRRVIGKINESLAAGMDTAVYTSRRLVTGPDSVASLRIGQIVSGCLIELVHGLRHQPRYLVAKGGITSSDVATKGLGVKRAVVLGQVQPGVPVWLTGKESTYPGMSYIIFPGNVGDDRALAEIQRFLR